jgi:hypothetical protein
MKLWFLRESSGTDIRSLLQDYLDKPGDFSAISVIGDWLNDTGGDSQLADLIGNVYDELNQHPPRWTLRGAADMATSPQKNSPVKKLGDKIHARLRSLRSDDGNRDLEINNGHLYRDMFDPQTNVSRFQPVTLDELNDKEVEKVVLLVLQDWLASMKNFGVVSGFSERFRKKDNSPMYGFDEMPQKMSDRKAFQFWLRQISQFSDMGWGFHQVTTNGPQADHYDNETLQAQSGHVVELVRAFEREIKGMMPVLRSFPRSKEMALHLAQEMMQTAIYMHDAVNRNGVDTRSHQNQGEVVRAETLLENTARWLRRTFV